MSTYEDEIRQALKADFDSGSLVEAGDAKDVFRLLATAYPTSGSRIDWARVPDAVECVDAVGPDRPAQFVEFFAEICDHLRLSGPVLYVGDNAPDFAIAASIETMKNVLHVLLEIPQHHFLVGPNGRWCFCLTMEGDIDFGRSAAPSLS
ncbi:hypothetical protein [Bradyrhizobium genosp. SA-3]|uniref:hypothetical protein n=1 Tax=Bradyrhizobium genosp. SA-3 TaxID=508868 RepID=UPI00102A234A|nr:hypothetical protein [Bradyrhizobium genosp. SA-3]